MILVSELFPRLHTLHTRWGGRRVSHSTFSGHAAADRMGAWGTQPASSSEAESQILFPCSEK
jgi:hypothetical protein